MVAIEHFNKIRERIGALIEELSEEQLFAVPTGFRNTIAWNAAHLVVTQQIILYGLSGLELCIREEVVEAFRKGTGLEKVTPQLFWESMEFLEKAPIVLAEDYRNGRFRKFETYTTSWGFVLNNIEEAIQFNNIHEGTHLGYMMAMRKSVG